MAMVGLAALAMVGFPQGDLKGTLDRILDDPKLAGAVVAAMVVDETGATVYERNAATRMVPASNQKILASAFALHAMGPDHRPQTRFWKQGKNLFIEAPGDPSITFANLKMAKAALGPSATVKINPAYRVGVGPSWEYDDLPNRYAAQVSAFGFDQAAFALWAVGGKPVLQPDSFGVRIDWAPRTGPVRVAYDPLKKVIKLQGAMPATRTRLDTLALPDPAYDAGTIFAPKVTFGTFPRPATSPTFVWTGDDIKTQIKDCLQPSDNLRAENLLLMAAGHSGPLGNDPYARAQQEMRKFMLEQVGADPNDLKIDDGSGLSRHNIVTARAIVKLLRWADAQPTRDLWRTAMAGPRRPGTLRLRLDGVFFEGKTGSLDMVSSLSGYLKVGTKEYTLSLLMNHFACSATEARNIKDAIVRALPGELPAPPPSPSLSLARR